MIVDDAQWDTLYHLIVEIAESPALRLKAQEIDISDDDYAHKIRKLCAEVTSTLSGNCVVEVHHGRESKGIFGPFCDAPAAREWIHAHNQHGMEYNIRPLHPR